MLACIPTNGDAGLKDTVSEHFGSAAFFTLYNTDTEELTIVSNRNAHHDHGTCHPMNHLAKYKIDCVVCGGMGRRAVEALNSEGIKIYQSGPGAVEELIGLIKAGTLQEIDPAKACRGHGQGGGCSHGQSTGGLTGLEGGRGSGHQQGLGGRHGRNGGGGKNQ